MKYSKHLKVKEERDETLKKIPIQYIGEKDGIKNYVKTALENREISWPGSQYFYNKNNPLSLENQIDKAYIKIRDNSRDKKGPLVISEHEIIFKNKTQEFKLYLELQEKYYHGVIEKSVDILSEEEYEANLKLAKELGKQNFEKAIEREKQRESLSKELLEKYKEQYKDNPNLVNALSKENIKTSLETCAMQHKPYQELNKFVEAMNDMPDRLKKNVPSMISLFKSESNVKVEAALDKFAGYKTSFYAKDSYIPGFMDILENYVTAEHERLTGKTPNESIEEIFDENHNHDYDDIEYDD